MNNYIRNFFIIVNCLVFTPIYAGNADADLFKGAELAAKYQCSDMAKEYDFDSEYASIHQFNPTDNISRDVESLKKIKEVSDYVKNNIAEACKTKKYIAGGWNYNGCMNKCFTLFNKNEGLKYKCVSACSSLNAKIESLPYILGKAISQKIVFDQNCKSESKTKINNSGREKKKVVESSAPFSEEEKVKSVSR
jgi:hypothetical protein